MQLQPPEQARSEQQQETTADGDEQPAEPSGAEVSLPLDVMFELLSNERRRWVLRYLESEEEGTTLGELAEHIASIENDKPEDALSSSERKRVYICLYQCHLPKMDDADVIRFDKDRKTVEVGRNFSQIAEYLPAEDDEPSETTVVWSAYYLGLSILGLSAILLQNMIFPQPLLSGLIIGALIVVAGHLTIAHLNRDDPPL